MNEDVKVDLIRLIENLPCHLSEQEAVNRLAAAVQSLMENDFPKLIDLLYRIDIDEKQLRNNLAGASPDKASAVIAKMLYERQRQKNEFKASFKSFDSDISEEDRW